MHKASASLVSLKDHERNLEVIESLLAQRFWRRGKRAAWYERRAIILGHLQRDAADKEKKIELQWKTLDGIKEALLDDDTGTGMSVVVPSSRFLCLTLKPSLPPRTSETFNCTRKEAEDSRRK